MSWGAIEKGQINFRVKSASVQATQIYANASTTLAELPCKLHPLNALHPHLSPSRALHAAIELLGALEALALSSSWARCHLCHNETLSVAHSLCSVNYFRTRSILTLLPSYPLSVHLSPSLFFPVQHDLFRLAVLLKRCLRQEPSSQHHHG